MYPILAYTAVSLVHIFQNKFDIINWKKKIPNKMKVITIYPILPEDSNSTG